MMSKAGKLSKALAYIIAFIVFCFYIFPFILIIINSFKSNGEILTNHSHYRKAGVLAILKRFSYG